MLARRAPHDLSPVVLDETPAEIQPMVTALNGLLGELKQTIDSRQRFIADAAHQIRTPMAGVLTRLDLARSGTGTLDAEQVEQLHAAVVRTVRVAHQLLALARSEQLPPDAVRQIVDLDELIRRAADDWVSRAIERDIDLGFDLAPARVIGVPSLLFEMIENLVGNALLYAGSGAQVNVGVETIQTTVRILIDDSGPGIAESDRDRAFQRFQRLVQRHDGGQAPALPGTGLGLSIVREIASRHGGTVTLGHSPLGGLQAMVELPSAAYPEGSGEAGPVQDSSS